MKSITLSQGKFALVDDEDYDYLNKWKWCAVKNSQTYYASRISDSVSMHRLISNPSREQVVDHKNRNGLDNRRSNLRVCTGSENQRNRPGQANNKSGYKGVSPFKDKFHAKIQYRHKAYHLGVFTTAEDAARAYDQAAVKLFGEFAYLNFPD